MRLPIGMISLWMVVAFFWPVIGGSGGSSDSEGILFEDLTSEVGVDFWHVAGSGGKYYMPEVMGAGVGLIDYDGDGDLDILLIQAGTLVS